MSARTIAVFLVGLLALSGVAANAQPRSARAAPAPVAAAPAPAPTASGSQNGPVVVDYILGEGDVIEVSVLGHGDFTTRARVDANGIIKLPYIGSTVVVGRTTTQVEDEVRGKLAAGGYFPNPIVHVEVASYASRYVIVLGAVGRPGLVPVDRAYRLSEILARVGSVQGDAADYVVLRRANGKEERHLVENLAMGDASLDPYVAPGDKIYAPKADLFFISGQVHAPGSFPVKDGMTLRTALATAGGITDQGSEKKIKIVRNGKPLPSVNLDDKVAAGDIITVGQRLF
jgi:polysaccharide export outer membrane protein